MIKRYKCHRVTDGFTMIELLAVISIIALLAALLFPAFGAIRRNAKETTTRTFLKSIETALAAYEFDWGFYPPDKSTVAGKTYESSEALNYYLTTAFRLQPNAAKGEIAAVKDSGPYIDIPERHRSDSDGDGNIEIIDLWNSPVEYDNIRDDTTTPSGFNVRNPDDPRTDGKPRNLQGYDLFSRGVTGSSRQIANFKVGWE